MKTIKTISAILFSALMLVSCGALRAPMVQKYEPIEAYKYFTLLRQANLSQVQAEYMAISTVYMGVAQLTQ